MKQRLRPIMFVGTGSDVGKSVVNTGFCRLFVQDGYHPAPFKSQNMSLNSYATPDGLEIGRAQAAQAEACGLPCMVEMNPILLKPTTHQVSQVVLMGKPVGNKSAREFFRSDDRELLFDEVMRAYRRLSEKYSPMVIEGAGSISEMNLWDKDIVNMRVAMTTGAATYLVADIDRGGVFASVYGSIMLLPPEQRRCIKGVVINKFRGDQSLFEEGKKIIRDLTGVPVVGVLPYFDGVFIEQEDGVILEKSHTAPVDGLFNIGVVRLPHISNFTDFNMLAAVEGVHLFFSDSSSILSRADMIIIPGSKNTIADLLFVRSSGIETLLQAHHAKGKPLYGICGGYQMLGEWVHDPEGIEGTPQSVPGLGILPVSTTLAHGKTTVQCKFEMTGYNAHGEAYEIHSGITETNSPLCLLEDGRVDGYYLNEKTWGTYLHGILDNADVLRRILKDYLPDTDMPKSYRQLKEEGYDRLAQWIRDNVDMEYIYSTLRI